MKTLAKTRGKTVKKAGNVLVKEKRIATPRPDLIVVKMGGGVSSKPVIMAKERASALLGKIATATRKPGANRNAIFHSNVGKRVYAYSVYSLDPSKIVREDASGTRRIGKLVNGRFRALPS